MASFDQSKAYLALIGAQSGLVSFSSLLVMITLNMYQVSLRFKDMARWMIYLDCLAFGLLFITNFAVNPNDACASTAAAFTADFIWAFKDACKYGYIVHRTATLYGKAKPWQVWLASGISLFLYFLYMGFAYDFQTACGGDNIASSGVKFIWCLPLLYIYWTTVSVVANFVLLFKLKKAVANVRIFENHAHKYDALIRREDFRVFLCNLMMVAASVCATMGTLDSNLQLSINAILFTFSQLLLFMSSVKPTTRTESDAPNSSLRPTSGIAESPRLSTFGVPLGATFKRSSVVPASVFHHSDRSLDKVKPPQKPSNADRKPEEDLLVATGVHAAAATTVDAKLDANTTADPHENDNDVMSYQTGVEFASPPAAGVAEHRIDLPVISIPAPVSATTDASASRDPSATMGIVPSTP